MEKNKPQINLISQVGGKVFSNNIINVSWNGTDLDGNNLSYAVLVSPDNGTTYNTIIFDLNETQYIINSSDLVDSKNYLLKVLVTDGVNTNESVINNTFEVDNDLNITKFFVVYSNQTERIFEIGINNTLNMNITNISWIFNSGQDTLSSNILFSLQPFEQIFIYINYNYSTTGSFTTSFKAYSSNFIEIETKEIII